MVDRRGARAHPLVAHAMSDRRRFITRAAAFAAAAAVGGPALAACSSSNEAGVSTVTTEGSGGAGVPPLAYDADRPYWMQGGFAPVAAETEAFDLEITGSLPPELVGLYVRNGSNPASGDSPHWFLGDGMVHGVRLDGGSASWYRNRYVRTPLYEARSGFLGSGAPGRAANQSNVSVFHHGGRLLSSGEVGFPYELSTDDLSTIGAHDYGGALTTAMTAHPKIDPVTGKMHFFGYGFVPPYLTYHVASPDGTLEYGAEVAVAGPTMIHDFAITENEAVFWELPVVFDLEAAVAAMDGATGSDGSFPFRWDPSYGARIGIVPLGGPTTDARWVEIDPCYVFHGVNAFRDGNAVVIDVCRLPSFFDTAGDIGESSVRRWRVGTAAPELTFSEETLSDVQMDLPSIDRRRTGRATRNAYFLMGDSSGESPLDFSGLARRDDVTAALDRYEPGDGYRMNEAFFVPGDTEDHEGWLLAYAWDRARDASDLVVLDAGDLHDGPVAQVHLPTRVPYGFHGVWVADT